MNDDIMMNATFFRLDEIPGPDERTEQDNIDIYEMLKLHETGGPSADKTFLPVIEPNAMLTGPNTANVGDAEMKRVRQSPLAMSLVLAYYARLLARLGVSFANPKKGLLDIVNVGEGEIPSTAEISHAPTFIKVLNIEKMLVVRAVNSLWQLGLKDHALNLVAYILRQFIHVSLPNCGYVPDLRSARPIIVASRRFFIDQQTPEGFGNFLCARLIELIGDILSDLNVDGDYTTTYHNCVKCQSTAAQIAYLPPNLDKTNVPENELPGKCDIMLVCGLSLAKVTNCKWQSSISQLKPAK